MSAPNIDKESVAQAQVPVEAVQKVEPEKVLVSWKAPARPFKRRDREYYVTLIAIVVIVGLVLFLVEGAMPVILLAALLFFFYILNTVEPETIEYQITNRGIKVADKASGWELLKRFWFSRRFDSTLLIFETVFIPGRLEIVVNKEDKDKIKKALLEYLNEEEAPPSFLDKAANWFTKKLPGNK